MGRKMIMSPVGAGNIDFDYVYSLYAILQVNMVKTLITLA